MSASVTAQGPASAGAPVASAGTGDARHAARLDGPSLGGAPREALDWTVHPARSAPARAAAGAAVLCVGAAGAAVVGGHAAWAVFALAVLGAAVAPFYLRTRYRADDTHLATERLGARRVRAWGALRRLELEPDGRGAWLSPFARRHWLDGVRGVQVRFDSPETARAFLALAAARGLPVSPGRAAGVAAARVGESPGGA